MLLRFDITYSDILRCSFAFYLDRNEKRWSAGFDNRKGWRVIGRYFNTYMHDKYHIKGNLNGRIGKTYFLNDEILFILKRFVQIAE